MITRTSNLQASITFVNQLFQQRQALEENRQQIATGQKVRDPGDNPGRAGTIAQFQATLNRLSHHKERISFALGVMEQQDGALNSAQDLLTRAKELAVQAANESNSAESRKAMATELYEIRDGLVTLANTRYQGRYIYGGADDDDPPFDALTYANPAAPAVGNARYVFDNEQGTALTRSVQVSDDDKVRITSSGSMFAESISNVERLARTLDGYRTDPEDYSTLPVGTGAAYTFPTDFKAQTGAILSAINNLDLNKRTLETERSDLGGRLNRLDQAKQIIETVQFNTRDAQSTLQESDIFEASSNLSNLETSLQALMATGARINNLSLLNYL